MSKFLKFLLKLNVALLLITSCTKNKKEAITLPDKPSIDTSAQKMPVPEEDNQTQNTPSTQSVNESPRLPAIIKSENTSSIGFQTSGIITKLNVQSGDFVKKNQILATLDSTSADFDLQNAKIDLESKKIVFQQNEKKYTSYLALFKTGTLSKITFEDEENNFKLAKLSYEAAEINLKSKEYALKLTQLAAPFDGVIFRSYKSLGDFVTTGVSVFDLVQTNDISVFAQVPLAFFGKIKTGMIFSIINPLNGQSANITIQKVVPVIDTQSHTFDIYGKINEINHNFFPGMYIEIILK